MSARISIGTYYGSTLYVLAIIFGILAFGLGVGLIVTDSGNDAAGYFFSILGAFFGLIVLVMSLRIAKGRRYITPTATGFILEDKRGTFELPDELITDLGTWSKVRYSNGAPKAIKRTGSIVMRTAESAGNMDFTYEYKLTQTDPLDEFLERNINRLVKNAQSTIDHNEDVIGDGWFLNRSGLIYTEKKEEYTLPWSEIVAVDIVDGMVSVWKKDEPRPIVKVKAESANALVLARILSKHLEKNPVKEEDDGTHLGRIIFERDKSWPLIGKICVLGITGLFALITIGGIVGVAIAGLKGAENALLGFVISFGIAVIFGLWFYYGRTSIFRCHTYGICRITSTKEVEMRYKDVRYFTYNATRMYYNGAYTGTVMNLRFEDQTGNAVKYNTTVKNADDEFDNLREHVSQVIASHMLKRLQAGKSVPWTDRVTFTKEGLDIRGKSGMLGKKDDFFLTYNDIADVGLEAGNFGIFTNEQKKAVYDCQTSTVNFFPGYYLLLTIRFSAPADDVVATEVEPDAKAAQPLEDETV